MALGSRQKKSLRTRLLAGRPFVECHYCGKRLTMQDMTLDHIHAKAKGGSDGIRNMLPACRPCNRMKGDMEYTEFLAQCRVIAGATA